jgi:site-specific recombinase XerD
MDDARTRKGRANAPINQSLLASLQTAKEAALSDHVVEYSGQRVLSIRKHFEAAVTRAGLAEVTQQKIRHSAAVAMVSSGVPIANVAQFLGHSNTAITCSTYGRFAPEHLADDAKALEFVKLKSVR